MFCDQCGEDIDPRLAGTCQIPGCPMQMDMDFDRISSALAYEDDEAILERVERRARALFNLSIYILVMALVLRFIIDRPVKVGYTVSYQAPVELTRNIDVRNELKLPEIDVKTPR